MATNWEGDVGSLIFFSSIYYLTLCVFRCLCVCVCVVSTLYWYVGSSWFHGSGLLVLFQLNIEINKQEFLHASFSSCTVYQSPVISDMSCWVSRTGRITAAVDERMNTCISLPFSLFFFTGLHCVHCCYCISDCNPSAFTAAGAEMKCQPVSGLSRIGGMIQRCFKVSRVWDL